MEYGNVLVVGNSGVGKSTLINAVLGDDAKEVAPTGIGISGTTKDLKIYEDDSIPFRLIDTIGFEPSFFSDRGGRDQCCCIDCEIKNSEDSRRFQMVRAGRLLWATPKMSCW